MSNTFGHIFRLTTFGESHGTAIGGIIDGIPAGFHIDTDALQHQLDRRRPGQSDIVTQRNEHDTVTLLSGLMDGITTGTPIGFVIPNTDHHNDDYDNLRDTFRPSHADYTYHAKYGIRDYRGGGRASARETASRVVAGGIAMQILASRGITIKAFTRSVGQIVLTSPYTELDLSLIDSTPVRCPDTDTARLMIDHINMLRQTGDTTGGTVTCVITGCPAGLGEPVADKLSASLAAAMMSINAAKGFELGAGFDGSQLLGSQSLDRFTVTDDNRVATASNHSGGIQGGISNGADIYFNVAFKPVATLMQDVETIDTAGNPVTLHARGRHDPCVVPRAIPIVEAMAAMTIMDAYLLYNSTIPFRH